MRIVALEEHYTVPALVKRMDPALIVKRGFPAPGAPSARPAIDERLAEFGDLRLGSLDASGISLQVISQSGPGADLLPPSEGPAWARDLNDHLADAISKHPARYAGFAHLPLTAPEAAADELERCVNKLGFLGVMVNGTTDGLFLDHPKFEPVLARAEALGAPLYIHPGLPPAAVKEVYFGGLPGPFSGGLAGAGWGWHAETAVHVLRLVLSGAFDRHPKLQIVIGHLSEGLHIMLDRFDETLGAMAGKLLQRKISQTILDQVHVTTSGFFYPDSFHALMKTFGPDRIMFSVDYPYSDNVKARAFLDALDLSPADRAKIAHGNADRLLKPKRLG